jgi:hypothetical protein
MTTRNPFAKDLPSETPSSPVETTEPLAGTTSYTGVIRGADEADECAHTALSLIYRKERDEARDERDAALAKVKIEHGLIHLETGGAFVQAVCRCGALLCGAGIVSIPSMLAAHIQEANAVPCPDSCGGQSWTRVGTSRGRRWRCDTCGRIISRYVTDAIQAADDRRAL